MNQCCVYFMRPIGQEGPVKIGYSYRRRLRLHEIRPWCPWPMEIAAWVEGDCMVERQFHQFFAKHHQHGEWFSAAPEITRAIDEIVAGTFNLSTLPEPMYAGVSRITSQRVPARLPQQQDAAA